MRLWRTLTGRQLKPVPGFLRFIIARLAIQLAEFQLSAHITGASRLAQQLKTHTAITRVAAIAAKQLPQSTLSLHHTLQGRLLEQAAGKAFNARGIAQTWAVQ